MTQPSAPVCLRAVLFDLDGTLVHTHIDFSRMKREVLELTAATGQDPDDYRSLDVLGIVDAVEARIADGGRFRAGVEEALVRIELAACEGAQPAEGAWDILHWLLARGIRVGIVTRNSVQATERVLSEIPLPHEVLLTRSHTPRVKPDPLHLHLALERLETKPEYSLMVGDHRMDVQAGKAAGTLTAGVLTPDRPDDYFDDLQPDLVIRTLPELIPWISPSSS